MDTWTDRLLVYDSVSCNAFKDILVAVRGRSMMTFKLMQPVVKANLLTPHSL